MEPQKEPVVTLPDAPSTSSGHPVVKINRERLWSNLMQLKEIGAYDDAANLPALGCAGWP